MLTVDQNLDQPQTSNPAGETEQLTLQIDRDLFRAFQRGVWIIVHETGRPRIEIMNEMVRDFLIKHGC
jgi:hypothetical protein